MYNFQILLLRNGTDAPPPLSSSSVVPAERTAPEKGAGFQKNYTSIELYTCLVLYFGNAATW